MKTLKKVKMCDLFLRLTKFSVSVTLKMVGIPPLP